MLRYYLPADVFMRRIATIFFYSIPRFLSSSKTTDAEIAGEAEV